VSKPARRCVAIFVPELGGGGAEMNALRLANEWAKAGVDIVFLVRKRGGSYESLLEPGIRVEQLLAKPVRSSTLNLLLSVLPLAKWLKRNRPDVLLSIMTSPAVHAGIAIRLAGTGTRHFASIQNSVAAEYLGPVGWVRRIEFWVGKRVLRRAAGVVALSTGVRNEVIELFGVPADRVAMIHNCGEPRPDAAVVPAAVTEQKARRFLLLACGRLVKQKNYPLLLTAFSQLRHRSDTELWILGEGPLRQELENLAAQLGIMGHIRFLGFRRPSTAWMQLADLFVLSSSWEGFANVIVEAMGVGVPVVSTDCPHGPGEIIGPDRFGVLVPVGDAAALAQAVDRLLQDEGERVRLAELGRSRALDFEPRALAPKFLNVLFPSAD
jgi:glycosyltransferase involved in cell wall biosynthesis